ncbi:hypothetical protein OE88DRAFT_1445352 [Heliocybe sulcata]|uniref:DUF6534 domain-containing protein n=1 Tax=Heliocybe sulcata TaxID=5364 RepID=A0A5C3NCP5_9AGAM|nr:hypothetical protein OE88DRAFT_1445352 [Heliocybe sulcata]
MSLSTLLLNLMRPLLLGEFGVAALYGLSIGQFLLYFRGQRRDSPIFRRVMFYLWIVDTAHTIFSIWIAYHHIVVGRIHLMDLLCVDWCIVAHILVTGAVCLVIRLICISRIWELTGKSRLLSAFLAAFSVLVFASVIVTCIKVGLVRVVIDIYSVKTFFYITLGSGVVVDAMIAATLSGILWRIRTQFKATNAILSRLMVYVIHTGLLLSACTLTSLISFGTRNSNVCIGLYLILSKVYLNHLLVFLNTRPLLGERHSLSRLWRVTDSGRGSVQGGSA